MLKPTWIREQAAATRVLTKFIRDHDGGLDKNLVLCLLALDQGDIGTAVVHARLVKPHGMGGLTDWWPSVKFENEDAEYVSSVLRALVNEWCRLMSLSFEQK